ncbi:MAG: hypothetical protein KJ650_08790, partial [Firmicutes bacterium]|nr:hypothetical protein [Bacillota bacterium]
PTPPELLAQLEPAREAVAGLGVANVVLEGYEADDILATLAERAKARHGG